METPYWALAVAYWLHMLATVVWIGGLAALGILVMPAARKALDGSAYAVFLSGLVRRLDPVGWFCLAVLLGTGMVQMSANPNYQGFLALDNRWAVAILLKHILFAGMVAISAYITWGLLPGLRRLALRRAGNTSDQRQTDSVQAGKMERLQRQETQLLRVNLALGVLVLLLTAFARAA